MAPHSKYVLVIYERSPDGSLSINTHTDNSMRLLGGCGDTGSAHGSWPYLVR